MTIWGWVWISLATSFVAQFFGFTVASVIWSVWGFLWVLFGILLDEIERRWPGDKEAKR